MKPGARYRSSVCETEIVIIRVPSVVDQLTCGSSVMVPLGEDAGPEAQLTEPEEGSAAVGKRYVDAETGLEVLCSKAGKGALRFGGRILSQKTAKPLPASD